VSADEPAMFAPPCTKTRTGRLEVGAASLGVQTLIVKQSSLPVTAPDDVCCTHALPNAFAARSPLQHAAGCGGFHRKSPTGGAAYGMPRNAVDPPLVAPTTAPDSTTTLFGLGVESTVQPAVSIGASFVVSAPASFDGAPPLDEEPHAPQSAKTRGRAARYRTKQPSPLAGAASTEGLGEEGRASDPAEIPNRDFPESREGKSHVNDEKVSSC